MLHTHPETFCMLHRMSSYAHNILCSAASSCIKFFKHINTTQYRTHPAQKVKPFPLSDVICKQSSLKILKFMCLALFIRFYCLLAYSNKYITVFSHLLCDICKTWNYVAKWQLPQCTVENVLHSLDGDMNKESGWWHKTPHVIQQVNMPVSCKWTN